MGIELAKYLVYGGFLFSFLAIASLLIPVKMKRTVDNDDSFDFEEDDERELEDDYRGTMEEDEDEAFDEEYIDEDDEEEFEIMGRDEDEDDEDEEVDIIKKMKGFKKRR